MPDQGNRSEAPENKRRNGPRLPGSPIAEFRGARIVAGPEVKLINITRGEALIEGSVRLLPGASLLLRLVCGNEVFHLKGRIQRSKASAISGSVLLYQAAICFESEFVVPERTGALGAEDQEPASARMSQSNAAEPFILAVTADCSGLDYNLHAILEMNEG